MPVCQRRVPTSSQAITVMVLLSACCSELLLTLLVQFSVSPVDLRLAHLRGLGSLGVADLDKRKQTVEMPVLRFPRNLELDHPVVDELRGDDFTGARRSSCRREPSRGHLRVQIRVDLLEVVVREAVEKFLRSFFIYDHALDVVEDLFPCLLIFAQERLLVLGLPF